MSAFNRKVKLTVINDVVSKLSLFSTDLILKFCRFAPIVVLDNMNS